MFCIMRGTNRIITKKLNIMKRIVILNLVLSMTFGFSCMTKRLNDLHKSDFSSVAQIEYSHKLASLEELFPGEIHKMGLQGSIISEFINVPDGVDYEFKINISNGSQKTNHEPKATDSNLDTNNALMITFNADTLLLLDSYCLINNIKCEVFPEIEEGTDLVFRKIADSVFVYLNNQKINKSNHILNSCEKIEINVPESSPYQITDANLYVLRTRNSVNYYVDKTNKYLQELDEQSGALNQTLSFFGIKPNTDEGIKLRKKLGDNSFIHPEKEMNEQTIMKFIRKTNDLAFDNLIQIENINYGCATGSYEVLSPGGTIYKATFENQEVYSGDASFLTPSGDTIINRIYYHARCFNPFWRDTAINIIDNVFFEDCEINSSTNIEATNNIFFGFIKEPNDTETTFRINKDNDYNQIIRSNILSDIQDFLNNTILKLSKNSKSSIAVSVKIDDKVGEEGLITPYLELSWEIINNEEYIEMYGETKSNYPSGSYLYEESKNVYTLLKSILAIYSNQVINNFLNNSNDININVMATADKPLPNNIEYCGIFGNIRTNYQILESLDSVGLENNHYFIELAKGSIINSNSVLAAVRAFGAIKFIKDNALITDEAGQITYNLQTKEYTEQIGDCYRKLTVIIRIKIPEMSDKVFFVKK
jgi:hypothetical protein